MMFDHSSSIVYMATVEKNLYLTHDNSSDKECEREREREWMYIKFPNHIRYIHMMQLYFHDVLLSCVCVRDAEGGHSSFAPN